ncbi:MAG: hypothetical protein IPP74_14850 [Alphaproteobacteria bacterium]|nr:hypothetical protein [Alphaproteobacteria bacterium]
MLLGNYNVFNANPGRAIGGPTDPTRFFKGSRWLNFFVGDHIVTDVTDRDTLPTGYNPPYGFNLALTAGGLTSRNRLEGIGAISGANLAGGRNATGALTGSGTVSNAALGLIASAVAALTGSGSITANIKGKLEAVAALVGSGDLEGALGALASMVSEVTGSGDVSDAAITAKAALSADILVAGGDITNETIAAAVWGALATAFNETGTMGEKLNDAGGAGNPWASLLVDNNDSGTFGERLQKLLTTAKFLGLK